MIFMIYTRSRFIQYSEHFINIYIFCYDSITVPKYLTHWEYKLIDKNAYLFRISASRAGDEFGLVERKKKLTNLFRQYDKVQSYIECLDSDSNENVIAAHAEERARFEEAYFQLMALYSGLVNSNKRKLFPNRSVIVLIKSHKIQIKLSNAIACIFGCL